MQVFVYLRNSKPNEINDSREVHGVSRDRCAPRAARAADRRSASTIAADVDIVDLQLGIADARGLLLDVLTTGDATRATKSLLRYVSLWLAR